jgi:hypothetical protein
MINVNELLTVKSYDLQVKELHPKIDSLQSALKVKEVFIQLQRSLCFEKHTA